MKNNMDNIGSIKISEEVISGIANLAACEVEGVIRIVPKGITSVKDFIPNLKSNIKGMSIVNNEDGLSITLQIAVKHGYNMQEVALKVQSNVLDAVQTMTGLVVKEINVIVASVENEKLPKVKPETNVEK